MKTSLIVPKALILLAVLCVAAAAIWVMGQRTVSRDIYVPTTVSRHAQQALRAMNNFRIYAGSVPRFDDLAGWRTLHDELEASNEADNAQAVERTGVSVTDAILGGVPVLDIRPRGWSENHKVLVYTHGGGYTHLSARSTLVSSAVMSAATGLRVIAVDYTTAPFAKWDVIQDQVISVFEALVADGYTMEDIALYGESAGGGLAISTVLNLRDRGLGMPAAVVLRSPWADLTNEGDTARTLKDADPMLSYAGVLEHSARAYAGGLDLNDPRISPVYANFSKGFSPSLIIDGTKCIFLSTSVRLFQALDQAGQETKLDIYEGMWHVFQLVPVPESQVSIEKSAIFINKHLNLPKLVP
jgi:acetyl esterase/lipase